MSFLNVFVLLCAMLIMKYFGFDYLGNIFDNIENEQLRLYANLGWCALVVCNMCAILLKGTNIRMSIIMLLVAVLSLRLLKLLCRRVEVIALVAGLPYTIALFLRPEIILCILIPVYIIAEIKSLRDRRVKE